ncbi:hypothetical protein [Haloarcula rara]|uniref:hypothetical protein n=1 Tax=Haloarcula rara TaxID=3033387 RepID=UPI0023E8357C|nr:hypothetical protein [Halomicroarcula sp. SHR3]
MSTGRLVPALAVVALLVLAGCVGVPLGESDTTTASPSNETPTASPTPSESASVTVDDAVTVENGTLPVNETLTFNRVEAVTGTDVDPWPVRVRDLSEWRGSVQQVGAVPLNRALGFENLSAAYEAAPRTTEQVIHNETPSEEPPAKLPVRNRTADRSSWEFVRNDTLGEMTTRATLDTELDRERAAAAAAGWGNDRLLAFQHATNDSRRGWVWVMRWDNETETDELEDALIEYTDTRGQNSDAAFNYQALDDTTVAVVFGDAEFANAADLRTADGTVSVIVSASDD